MPQIYEMLTFYIVSTPMYKNMYVFHEKTCQKRCRIASNELEPKLYGIIVGFRLTDTYI